MFYLISEEEWLPETEEGGSEDEAEETEEDMRKVKKSTLPGRKQRYNEIENNIFKDLLGKYYKKKTMAPTHVLYKVQECIKEKCGTVRPIATLRTRVHNIINSKQTL